MKTPALCWLAMVAARCLPLGAASIDSTFNPDGTSTTWSDADNWDHSGGVTGVYPLNGLGGNTFNVFLGREAAALGEDITIDSLDLNDVANTAEGSKLSGGSHTLSVLFNTSADGALLTQGTFVLGIVDFAVSPFFPLLDAAGKWFWFFVTAIWAALAYILVMLTQVLLKRIRRAEPDGAGNGGGAPATTQPDGPAAPGL